MHGTSKENKLMNIVLGAVCWSLWLMRNDLVFQNKLCSSPQAVVYRVILFL
uniref:Uncharacterized protein n=1 Tax=Arundo donax TaxID=35708 RepID=A0A0A8XTB9_ARUDO